ncbi:unnamed protein product [Alopecurus aequalis]
MGKHAYDNSSMSPSMAAAQRMGSSRHHTTVPSSKTTTTRPAIKIIHIVAPEIIKTDASNFRDLVQRLTGRQAQLQSAPAAHRKAVTVAVEQTPPSTVEEKPQKKRLAPALADDFVAQHENRRRKKIKCEVVKVEEEGFGGGDLDFGELWMWMDLNPGSFLSFLEEDTFQGMAPEFVQPPLGASRMDLIGEMCASYLA